MCTSTFAMECSRNFDSYAIATEAYIPPLGIFHVHLPDEKRVLLAKTV